MKIKDSESLKMKIMRVAEAQNARTSALKDKKQPLLFRCVTRGCLSE